MPKSKNRDRICQNCGKDYELGVDSNQHKYCSVECRQKWHYNRWKSNGGKRCPKKSRNYLLKHNYGITVDDFNIMLKSQDSKCFICETDNPGGKNWHVDHCHNSGKVRKILCQKCNQVLGMVNEKPAVLNSMIEYLELHNES